MMQGVTEKAATSSSFSEQVKKTLGNFFPFTLGTGTGDEVETQEEEEDDDEHDDFGSQLSLNRETGSSDRLGVVKTKNKIIDASQQSREFVTMANSEVQPVKNRNTGISNPPREPEADYKETSRKRRKTRFSISTNFPGTNRVTQPLATPLVNKWASIEEALTSIVNSIGEQNEHMSLRMSELEKVVHVERESLRAEINCNRQEVSRSEKRSKERTYEHLAKNLSRMTREAEQREIRLSGDMEKLRSQQEQTLETLDTRIDAMMDRRTQAIMDRLDGLLGNRSGSRNRKAN